MTAAQIRSFRESESGQEVGQTKAEAEKVGANVLAGHEVSKKIEKIISKAAPYRGKKFSVPPWTNEEWGLVGDQVRYISRARANVGDLTNNVGEPTKKANAMKLWGRDEIKAKTKFPDKNLVKQEIKNDLADYREELKKEEQKANK